MSMSEQTTETGALRQVLPHWLGQHKVIPVVTVPAIEKVDDIANNLMDKGHGIIELTLRTPCALDAIRHLKANYPALVVGAGTVITPQQFTDAVEAGSDFVVSPGFTGALLEQATIHQVPYIPGVQTLSEMMTLAQQGYQLLKLFPAELSGGVALLKAAGQVLPGLQFMPTGGIKEQSSMDYLALENVACVGGSWCL